MLLELTTGVSVPGEGGVCAGVIGELAASHAERSETHAALLRAAAIAQSHGRPSGVRARARARARAG